MSVSGTCGPSASAYAPDGDWPPGRPASGSKVVCSTERATARVIGVVRLTDVIRLGLFVVLLVGLAVTAPVTCVCVPSDHGDLSIHPIFAHAHPSDVGHSDQGHHHPSQEPASDFEDGQPLPSVRSQAGSGAISPFAAGASILMLLHPWRLHVGVIGPAWRPAVLLPPSIAHPPLLPPPRSSN